MTFEALSRVDTNSKAVEVVPNQPPPALTSSDVVNAVYRDDNPLNALRMPRFDTAIYTFNSTKEVIEFQEGRSKRLEYGRYGNPNVEACEETLAKLEYNPRLTSRPQVDAALFGTGMTAITTALLTLLKNGDHLIIGEDCYRRTRETCNVILRQYGIGTTVVPLGDFSAIEEAIRPTTRIIVMESPTNPFLRVTDLNQLATLGKDRGIITLIDSTFATPINQRPLEYGIDLVTHSATKYLGAYNEFLAGSIAGAPHLIEEIKRFRGVGFGGIPPAQLANDLLKSIETLELRVSRQNENGLKIARFLETHPAIDRVWYPGLVSHPDYKIALEQMSGFGGVVTFTVKGGFDQCTHLIDSVRQAKIGPSLGGTKSLIESPLTMSYWKASHEVRKRANITENLVRYSAGIENANDLIADLDQALSSVPK